MRRLRFGNAPCSVFKDGEVIPHPFRPEHTPHRGLCELGDLWVWLEGLGVKVNCLDVT